MLPCWSRVNSCSAVGERGELAHGTHGTQQHRMIVGLVGHGYTKREQDSGG